MHAVRVALVFAMLLFISESGGGLHAYLDPGTGSIALQLIIGSVVAVLTAVRLYWDRLKGLVRRTPRPGPVATKEP